jgi:hypothetical protein
MSKMNYAKIEKEHRALTDWMVETNWQVFGTLKFTDGSAISLRRAENLVCKYFNKLDRAYYGNAATNVGMRHNRVVVKHMGTSGTNLHYHFLAKPDTDPALFADLARKQWAHMSSWTMGFADTDIAAVRSNKGSSIYMLHEYDKLGADTVFLQASALNAPKYSPLKYRNIRQMRRLLAIQSLSTKEIEYDDEDAEDAFSIT